MTLVIGLTGGIASGKSTVSQMIKEKGIRVVDADIIAKEAVSKGSSLPFIKSFKLLVKRFFCQMVN